jgi:hypothetical protein
MRIAAFALLGCLAGCSLTTGGSSGECQRDSQCGDDICARGGECLSRTAVREVQVHWTINGATADATACTARPNMYLQFESADYGDTLRVTSVPCYRGVYSIDRLPKRYVQVELGFQGGASDVSPIETSQVQFDLFQ